MGNVEIPNWLKVLPLAPVFRPTDTEFADPIAYISKIEKEASAFGICKIIPPLPKPSKKYVFHNLNKSLLKCPELVSDVDVSKVCKEDRAVFTTRQQELGQTVKKTKGEKSKIVSSQRSGVKQVWQSGGVYTLEQFEAKSKTFYKSQLGTVREVSPVVVEALFWKAASEKPIYIEYANDVPGSAFGEPEGHYRHFRQRKRRGRGFYQRKTEINDPSGKNSENSSPEVEKAPLASTSLSSQGSSKQKSMDILDEMEGTAGWKLSNSSWNLQTIARSPGSVTRFMPDDIPGVTSPMVYIGMLFSWFAWHVEDHELHSMNYLHTGSPKTWYAVPCDYALEFEEVIRKNSYGRNIDQLAALTQLGEKTTLVSPEMIVASGIPCCRLVQNPGEFVVTFPRSYHVGFSHGFNCGEAANFGTPQWLNVAKEAAVRRAAMNYLPMLSHQQLLYLLTMSFVSRVPRSFLPGGRSSRLRDRQREEREFLVKKAFVEDILNENKNLSALLREPSSRLVMWDPDLLPRHTALALAAVGDAATSAVSPPAVAKNEPEEVQNKEKTTLLEELSLFMEKLNDVYYDEDDGLLNDFQVDSGTLPCVACGVLGFPFMSVVQPSEEALKDLSERQGEIDAQEVTTLLSEKSQCEWKTSSRYIRPRIFCLEHTIELQRLLQSRGGLKFLIICHKDFQKFKAHAAIVAEEVKVPFSYDDVLLESASQEELSLIDLAIEDEKNYNHALDWTSELGINLRYCVKVRKNSPTKKIQHALSLGGLFSDASYMLDISSIRWLQRKTRSKAKPSSTSSFTPREHLEVKVDGKLGESVDSQAGRKEEKIIQYSRKKKSNPKLSAEQGQELAPLAKSKDFDKTCNTNASKSHLDSAIRSELNNEIGDSGRVIGRNEKSFSKNPCSSSFTEAHDQEHPESTIKFGSALDGNVTNRFSMVNGDSAGLSSVSREHRGQSMTSNNNGSNSGSQTILVSTGDNHDGPGKLPGDYVCSDVSVRGVQEAVEMSDQEFGEPRSTVTNIEDEQQSQMVQPTKREAVSGDHAQVDRAEAVCTRENLCSDIILHTEHSSAQVGMEIPEINTASENMVVNMTHDGEPLESSDILSSSNRDQASSNGLQVPDDGLNMESEVSSSENTKVIETPNPMGEAKMKWKIESESETNDNLESSIGFIRSPCEGLRSRGKRKATCETSFKLTETIDEEKKPIAKRLKKTPKARSGSRHQEVPTTTHPNRCYVEGCKMTFESKAKLQTHKRNRCTHEGCGKKFRAHKYLVLHQRVHNDERPFECSWEGCLMTFKWQWARTEHLRLHTGERPYKCKVEECGLSFRFVSDYSRHRRKTGHYVA